MFIGVKKSLGELNGDECRRRRFRSSSRLEVLNHGEPVTTTGADSSHIRVFFSLICYVLLNAMSNALS